MQRIVDGLLYDTELSELIYVDKMENRQLFMTPNRRFFTLYGTGEIIPKSEEATKEYLGKYDVDKYVVIFGNVEEA